MDSTHGLLIQIGDAVFTTLSRLGATLPIAFIPIIILDTLTTLPSITHSFELLDLPTDQYQFAIGMDLIPTIFPDYIKTSLILKPVPCPTFHDHINAKSATISASEGQGAIPWEETPIRVSTNTSSGFEPSYAQHRQHILESPDIQSLLHVNEHIAGF